MLQQWSTINIPQLELGRLNFEKLLACVQDMEVTKDTRTGLMKEVRNPRVAMNSVELPSVNLNGPLPHLHYVSAHCSVPL